MREGEPEPVAAALPARAVRRAAGGRVPAASRVPAAPGKTPSAAAPGKTPSAAPSGKTSPAPPIQADRVPPAASGFLAVSALALVKADSDWAAAPVVAPAVPEVELGVASSIPCRESRATSGAN